MSDLEVVFNNTFQNDRTVVLIDGANIWECAKMLNFIIDWRKMKDFFTQNFRVTGIHFFTAVFTEKDGHIPLQKTIDWLAYNGFITHTKDAKVYDSNTGGRKIKGNIDIEIAILAMQLALSNRVDHIILVSGDSDFAPLLAALQSEGVTTTIVSSIQTEPRAICGDALRRQANYFLEVADLRKDWWKSDFPSAPAEVVATAG